MSNAHGLYSYPPQAAVGRVLPKNKVYEHARPGSSVRALFVSQVEQITWAYKLAPETINLAATADVPEIEIFDVTLKGPKLDPAVLLSIDKAIPYPTVFQLRHSGRVRAAAAYKRPSEADAGKWVVGEYFFATRQAEDRRHPALPVALDLRGLYEQLIRLLLPLSARAGETLRQHIDRLALFRGKQAEIEKLVARMSKEKQFNRKVELNAQLRAVLEEFGQLAA